MDSVPISSIDWWGWKVLYSLSKYTHAKCESNFSVLIRLRIKKRSGLQHPLILCFVHQCKSKTLFCHHRDHRRVISSNLFYRDFTSSSFLRVISPFQTNLHCGIPCTFFFFKESLLLLRWASENYCGVVVLLNLVEDC